MRIARSRIVAALAVAALGGVACAGDNEPAEEAAVEPEDADADEAGEEAADAGDAEEQATADTAETCDDVDLSQAPAEPAVMRIGHGFAAEEPFWLMTAQPDLTQHDGSWYEMDLIPFRGTEGRLQAYQAGELDAVVISPQAQIRGEATGALDLYAMATIMREAEPDAYSGTFLALEDSGIETTSDLQGKRIAVVDIGSHWDYLARASAEHGGLDPDSDVEYVVFPFPAQEEALRGGQVDVIGLPEPLYSLAIANGGVTPIISASELTDFAYDLLTLSFDRGFVADHLGAVCAWVEDYQAAMEEFRTNTDAARTVLAGTEFISLPLEVYLETGDYARPEGGVVDTEGMAQMLDVMIESGVLTEDDRIDVDTLVLPGVTAGQ